MRQFLALATILPAIAACSGGSTDTSGGTGTSHVLLTDDPFPYSRVAHVDLYVLSVSGSLA